MMHQPFDLTDYNSYGLPARARAGIVPRDAAELVEVLRAHPDAIVIGSGHNLILQHEWYDALFVVVSLPTLDDRICRIEGDVFHAYAGASMVELSRLAGRLGLGGLEPFFDIPSSLGGAVVMNAGAGGEEIKDVLIEATVFDRSTGEQRSLTLSDIGYAYRQSVFQKRGDLVVTSASLRLRPGVPEVIQARMEAIKAQRWAKQPRDWPNAGSVFKRPPGYFVGALMDELKLKGRSVGGAQLSTKHGGFIVNTGGARGDDILALIAEIKAAVRARYGVDLEQEQIVI